MARSRIVGIVLDILIALLVVFNILAAMGVIMYVPTGSMVPTLMPGDLIIVKPTTTEELIHDYMTSDEKPIIVYEFNRLSYRGYIVHRLYKIIYDENGNLVGFKAKGDANPTPDLFIVKPEDVKGKVIARIPYLGYTIIFARTPLGFTSVSYTHLTLPTN